MRSNDKKSLKRLLDRIEIQPLSPHFEQRIYQDWQRTVSIQEQPIHRPSEVLALARFHPRLVGLFAILVISTSVLMAMHFLTSQDEELHQIDVLSELSLSTI